MKILNLIQCTNLGGMEQASLRLMRGLMGQGNTVELLSLNPVGQLGPLLQKAGIEHDGLPYLGKGGWRSYGLLRQKLTAVQADAIIMTGHHLLGSLSLNGHCTGRRILAIHYHHEGVKPRWQWRLIYRLACRKFDAITFPCDFIRREAESIYPPVKRLAHTVHNPLDVPELPTTEERAAARRSLNLPLDRPIVGNAGWLIPRKRFDVFLQTAAGILKQRPDAVFVVAGSGDQEENLKRLADELGITANVQWLGWQQQMANFYKSLDVLLFNSDWDAMGLTPLEAMSYGVPAVCSVVNGGLREIINSDNVGILLPQHDTELLAQQVVRLLNNPPEAVALGLAGRAHLEEVCNPAPIVDWYAQALSGRIPPSVAGGKSLEKPRAAVVFHRVGPYHFARARAASKRLDTTLVEVFKSDDVYGWDPVPGCDGFKRMTLFERNTESTANLVHGVRSALDECRPDVVAVPGWADAVAFGALEWCDANNVPAIVMSETTQWDESRKAWKEWIKRRILKLCATGLVGGRPHAEYLMSLGMASGNIFQGYDAVDNEHFSRRTAECKLRNHENRKQLGLPENFFLASARFVEKKNLLGLIDAYARYRRLAEKALGEGKKQPIWSLVLLGDGPLHSTIVNFRSSLGLDQSVYLPGFKQYDELPVFYALANVFIHASTTEQWGLVVNEAMASGLPVLVSNRCGCAQDLVQDGVNGFAFDPSDIGKIASLMQKVSAPDFPLAQFGAESQRIIGSWGPERFASGLVQAVETALAAPRPIHDKVDGLLLRILAKV